MGMYLLKMLLLLPLLAGLVWGSLWLTRKAQGGINARNGCTTARLVESTMLAPGMRLAVIEFHGKEILVGTSKQGLVRLAEADAHAISKAASVPVIEDNNP